MIKLKNIFFTYGKSNFSLSFHELFLEGGSATALIGPSGSGKTTLLNLVSGITLPQKGTVKVEDTNVHQLSDQERRFFRITKIGFIFQDFALLDYLNVEDNIFHPYRITNALALSQSVRKRTKDLAEGLGIGNKLRSYPHELSQGEKQRAAICRALLPKPKVLLSDEATGNLDPKNKIKILDLLLEPVLKEKITLLAVTHDHELLKRFDRVINLQDLTQEEKT